jgi:hypothetical protein
MALKHIPSMFHVLMPPLQNPAHIRSQGTCPGTKQTAWWHVKQCQEDPLSYYML